MLVVRNEQATFKNGNNRQNMAFTEKVSLSGTALSFLFYECVSSTNGQEGFLIGNVTSEITNHISDLQSDNTRLDTQIIIRTILPLPSVSQFYMPTGRIKEDFISDFLSDAAREVVGWYKYRRNINLKPTFRDKLISKGLQKYFERNHGRKNFVTCNISSKTSVCNSTHTFTYRFGKINCYNMYEYIEDVTANLGEKLTGYKKPHKRATNYILNKIIAESNVQNENTTDAILRIQKAVDTRLTKEAKTSLKTENAIRELEFEIKQMNTILAERHIGTICETYDKLLEEERVSSEVEMVEACVNALKPDNDIDIFNISNYILNKNQLSNETQTVNNDSRRETPSPILMTNSKPSMSYSAALSNAVKDACEASSSTSNLYSDDLIDLDVPDNKIIQKSVIVNDDPKHAECSSPEY